MSRTLSIPAGTPVAFLGGVPAVLSSPTVVDFGDVTFDELAGLFAQAPASEDETIALLALLEHTDPETGHPVRYTPQGIRVVVPPDEAAFFDVREAVEEGLEEIDTEGSQEEAEQDAQADLISEKVARATDAITSPSEAAEAGEAVDGHPVDPVPVETSEPESNTEDVPPGPPQEQEPQDDGPVSDS